MKTTNTPETMTHTQEEWLTNENPFGEQIIYAIDNEGDKLALAKVFANRNEYKANVRLIVAAPEMLKSLQDVANMCKDHLINGLEFNPVEIMENVEQVIKKAEG